MMRRFQFLLMSGALLLFSVASTVQAQVGEATATAATASDAEKHRLRLKGIDGKHYDLAEMRGEVVMVSFGATWCAPCVWELAAIEELKLEYVGKPVRFLWVSIEGERETSNSLLRHYAKSYRLTIPVLRDPTQQTFAQFSSSVRLPLVVFFDQTGKFVAPTHRGMSQEPSEYKQLMRRRLDALLRNSPTPAGPTPGAAKTVGAHAAPAN